LLQKPSETFAAKGSIVDTSLVDPFCGSVMIPKVAPWRRERPGSSGACFMTGLLDSDMAKSLLVAINLKLSFYQGDRIDRDAV
jgi:hypothetical protein